MHVALHLDSALRCVYRVTENALRAFFRVRVRFHSESVLQQSEWRQSMLHAPHRRPITLAISTNNKWPIKCLYGLETRSLTTWGARAGLETVGLRTPCVVV